MLMNVQKDLQHFNSRPHEEVDLCKNWFKTQIMQFQLTTSRGGRPNGVVRYIGLLHISTHDLTRRSTRLLRCILSNRLHFNSRPHEEVDLSLYVVPLAFKYFNSRPHEEVDLQIFLPYHPVLTFQLTTSRGGRPS